MKFSVLGSGSKGNCTLVVSGRTKVLIDNGFSGKELIRRLQIIGIEPGDLTAVVVTHEHTDHVKGIGVLARKFHLPIYANEATYKAAEINLGHLPVRKEFATGEAFEIEELHIHPFAVSHDSADPVGFVLGDGEHRLGYCTDTGTITRLIRHHLRVCRTLILEANHDVQMLRQGPYPLRLQQRVLSNQGHLANTDSLEFAKQLVDESLQCLVLAHLSEINNRPELVVEEARRRLSHRNDLRFMLAEQTLPCPLTDI